MKEPSFSLDNVSIEIIRRTPQKTLKEQFLEACSKGDVDRCRDFYNYIYDEEILSSGARVACEHNCEQVILEFLRSGVTNHKRDQKDCWMGWTLLHHTCQLGHIKTALVLIENGSDTITGCHTNC
eukprot:TRINITY_DN20850_c0_g1_i1.p1 TRINITY_DN20850_c0_g1~~TRINITY_DN20850_c0_g1_i1.p1  ORF type:complete len:125 (-),score=11.57 TRINITY_DN20850_c0_g1_i1:102-476(-)